jgi:hypothetical protein
MRSETRWGFSANFCFDSYEITLKNQNKKFLFKTVQNQITTPVHCAQPASNDVTADVTVTTVKGESQPSDSSSDTSSTPASSLLPCLPSPFTCLQSFTQHSLTPNSTRNSVYACTEPGFQSLSQLVVALTATHPLLAGVFSLCGQLSNTACPLI